ncbi:MAG: site-specific DNA-methyltransferase [Salinivirgaceae bacterium]|nr:site-specific DNA-methyltransferase [Salinivirgaceae bacterium]
MPTLNWIGKEAVVNHHNQVPFRTLDKKYTFGGDDSENKIIHGDNLEALKALLPEYEGRIKCIYIDPPYNTGASPENGGWIYYDNVDSPRMRRWLGQVVGNKFEDLSCHDKWLCMMYPRLKLLQKMLSKDGAIFISIDDIEQHNLRLICDDIFGERNFVAQFIWHNEGHSDNQDDITSVHEYVLCYAKDKTYLKENHIVDPTIDESSKILNNYAENSITKNGAKNPPSIVTLKKGFPCEVSDLNLPKHNCIEDLMNAVAKDGYITRDITKKLNISYPARLDDMIVQNGQLVQDCRVYSGWMNNAKLNKFIENEFNPLDDKESKLRFFLSKNGVVYYRRDGRETHYIQTVLENMGTTETNKYMLESMEITFSYPKPCTLIEFLLSIYSDDDSIILDSFAGSGTTAHAVLNLNNQKGGNRKFILVEMGDFSENITAKRIKCVINGYGDGKTAIKGIGGSFSYYELGEPIFNEDSYLNESVGTEKLREYVWYTETRVPYTSANNVTDARGASLQYLLGNHNGTAYYFYYEPDKITTLDKTFLNGITEKAEQYVIYADNCLLSDEFMQLNHIIFNKIPRDIKKI